MLRITTYIEGPCPAGQSLLRPLTLIAGHSYKTNGELIESSLTKKVAIVALTLLFLPLYLPGLALGLVLVGFSSTHKKAFEDLTLLLNKKKADIPPIPTDEQKRAAACTIQKCWQNYVEHKASTRTSSADSFPHTPESTSLETVSEIEELELPWLSETDVLHVTTLLSKTIAPEVIKLWQSLPQDELAFLTHQEKNELFATFEARLSQSLRKYIDLFHKAYKNSLLSEIFLRVCAHEAASVAHTVYRSPSLVRFAGAVLENYLLESFEDWFINYLIYRKMLVSNVFKTV